MSTAPGLVTILLRLPLLYNPDASDRREAIEDEKFMRTAEEIAERFGGGTLFVFRRDEPHGFWWDQGLVERDTLALLELDAPDTVETRDWLRTYARSVLLERFRQRAIYVKFVRPVEQLIVTDEEVRSDP
jgi:hypothetical protein